MSNFFGAVAVIVVLGILCVWRIVSRSREIQNKYNLNNDDQQHIDDQLNKTSNEE